MKKFKGSKGNWKSIFTSDNSRAIRNKGGIICVLPKPSKYSGQDKRYEDELTEVKANQQLISCAPEMLKSLKEFISMYEKIEPAGGYQGVYDTAISLIKKATE